MFFSTSLIATSGAIYFAALEIVSVHTIQCIDSE